MKIIIQCANGKSKKATNFVDNIQFVANPENKLQFRPDDKVPNHDKTWREVTDSYNEKYRLQNVNPKKLLKAGELYKHKIYKQLIKKVGEQNVFILSAGWGLVRANFLLPTYNITFSGVANKVYKRKVNDLYNDYNHLIGCLEENEEVIFFGGGSYLTLFYELTKNVKNKKNIKIYYATDNIEKHPEYSYIKYPRCFTNWHYQAANDFITLSIRA